MYHALVAARVRGLWRRIETDGFEVAVRQATPGMTFTFVGDTPLGARLTGREEFRGWFERAVALLPGLRISAEDVTVAGPPWNTRVAVRLAVRATLRDGTVYTNQGVQWIRLRWGRLVDDWVLEDTLALARACAVQQAEPVRPT
ncbi:nuclear transport factor 2 family protein [Microbispora sp. NPDC049125]|uniref:nuclear transport factor 2 family protein n=1 Tax=Microbispora sp. NPDC049125 TaxID=3154929 RepID=UPI0034672B78